MSVNYEALFNDSYRRVQANQEQPDGFYALFYRKLLQRSPEVESRFVDVDMRQQQAMLKKSFVHLLNFFVTRQASDRLVEIASMHNRDNLDIPPALYDEWLAALLDTVESLDPSFDREVRLAWTIVMAAGITYMKDHYDR